MWITVIGWGVFVLACYPGYLSFDSIHHLGEVRSGIFTDAHPLVMSQLWSLAEYVVAGPFPMLALQSALFLFGLAAVLRRVLSPRAASLTAIGVLMFPPVFAPMAVIWPEPMLAGALLGAAGGLLSTQRNWRIVGVACLVLACSCRPEIVVALIPIAGLAFFDLPSRRRWRNAIALVLVVAAFTRVVERILVDEPVYNWQQKLELMDIAGGLRHEKHLDDAELRRSFDGLVIADASTLHDKLASARDAFDWFPIAHGDTRLVDPVTSDAEANALAADWQHLIWAHHTAYALHRWQLTRRLIGLVDPWSPVWDDFGDKDMLMLVHHRATASDVQLAYRAFVRAAAGTVLFRPYLYVVLAVIALGLVWRRRELRALVASGLLLELALVVFAPSAEYRFSHWLVTTACIALAASAVRLRWRAAAPRT